MVSSAGARGPLWHLSSFEGFSAAAHETRAPLNGGRVPGEYLKVASVADARRIVLASDGYPQVAVEGRLERGLAEDHLAALLKGDPRCVIPGKLQGTKCLDEAALREGRSFDDRSWLELTR